MILAAETWASPTDGPPRPTCIPFRVQLEFESCCPYNDCMGNLPCGTVTFLFTDIEGSTRLAQQYPDSIGGLLERHHAILKNAIEGHGGYIFHIIGDAFCAAFQTVREAVDAAVEAQRCLAAESWSPEPVRVRMGISTGSAQVKLRDDRPPDYCGYLNLARVQRVMSVAYAGQILLSNASAGLTRGELPANMSLRDLGEHRLKSLLNPERLWQVVGPGLQADFPTLKSLNAIPNNLPLQLTSFIGREHEREEVKNLLQTHRLVSLTGAGGTGKSRLALQVAADVLDQFHNGVWFIELAPITDPALILQTVVRVLGLTPNPGSEPLDVLKGYLADKCLLLILDNCEHLLDDACRFADAILKAAPQVKIMPTSREALNLAGEQAYQVPSLSAPDLNHLPPVEQITQYEAVHLFIERAALASPKFAVTNSNAAAVAQICCRLDGIPLAIELAAARVKAMPLEAIVHRLDDRFRLLTGGSRTALPRQQTLRAMIDWSYNLLSEPERLTLQHLSVFRGGWTLEGAEAICDGEGIEELEVADQLSRLVDKSLVSMDENGRYRMLETVRQYAAEKLIDSGQAEWARDQHLNYMVELAETAEPAVYGQDQKDWLDRLDAELDNVRAACQWAEQSEPELFLRLASALWRFCEVRSHYSEGLGWLQNAINATNGSTDVIRARALARASHIASQLELPQVAKDLATEGARLGRILGDQLSLARCLCTLGFIAMDWENFKGAPRLFEESLSICRKTEDHGLISEVLAGMWTVALHEGDVAAAQSWCEQCLQESRFSGDIRRIGFTLLRLAATAYVQDDYALAQSRIQEAQQQFSQIGDTSGELWSYLFFIGLIDVEICLNDLAVARQVAERACELARSLGERDLLAHALERRGIVALAEGDAARATEYFENDLHLLRQGRNTLSLAWPFAWLGEAARQQGNAAGAKSGYGQAFAAAQQLGPQVYWLCLQGLGAIALANGLPKRAVQLLGAQARLRRIDYTESHYPFIVRDGERLVAEAHAQLGEEAFHKAWAEGQAMSEEQMLDYALEGS